jgi:hypothetical protein
MPSTDRFFTKQTHCERKASARPPSQPGQQGCPCIHTVQQGKVNLLVSELLLSLWAGCLCAPVPFPLAFLPFPIITGILHVWFWVFFFFFFFFFFFVFFFFFFWFLFVCFVFYLIYLFTSQRLWDFLLNHSLL